jgi:hypothetical protein
MPDKQAVQEFDRELEDALGTDVSEQDAEEALNRPASPRALTVLRENQLLLVITFATAVVLGVIGSLAANSWWVLLIPLAFHALGTTVVVATSLRLSTQVEKPDPVTVARLEAEGVRDPEQKMNDAIQHLAGDDDKSRLRKFVTDDVGPIPEASDSPAEAAAKQQVAEGPVEGSH